MSGFAAHGASFEGGEGTEIERLQDEFRRRQALAAGSAAGAPPSSAASAYLAAAVPRPGDPYGHLGMLGAVEAAASPYYARQAAAAAAAGTYARAAAGDPYAALAAAQRDASAPAGSPAASTPLTDLYSQKQQAIQQAVAASAYATYGAAAASTPGAVPSAPVPGGAATAVDHYSRVYGIPPPPPTSAGTAYPPPPPEYSAQAAQAAQEIAIMRHAYNQERERSAIKRAGGWTQPSRNFKQSPGTPKSKSGSTKSPSSAKSNASGGSEDMGESSLLKKETAVLTKDKDGKAIVEDRGNTWYMGCVPLGVDDDKYWLSELQVYLRANFAEAFAATEEDIAAPMHGRNKPIALGQVGIRCMHCKHDNPAERGQQATSYPSLISGIYNSVQQMLRLHLDCCLSMPPDVRAKIENLKVSCSSRGGRKQYWIDSAKRLGLVNTPHGIHFVRDPSGPLPPLAGPSVNSKEHRKKKATPKVKKTPPPKPALEPIPPKPAPVVDSRPLVFPEDKPLISDYLYLTLEQMGPCTLMEADRVGCYKTRKVGFPGLACRHCVGQAGCGRYFPASEASLSQTTTSQTIMNHVRNCRRCPIEIRENLEIMKRNRMGPDGKRADKPKHGGRKVFFHRLWCRIQGLPIEEREGEAEEPKRRKKKAGKSKKSRGIYEDEIEGEGLSSDEDSGTEDDDSNADSFESGDDMQKTKRRSPSSSSKKKKATSQWFEGCVRLTKEDDPHWLSEMECFARSDLIEVFSLRDKHDIDGYGGRKEPARGQVGIRCVFCKSLDPSDRPNGCVNFPDVLSSIHTKVADMIRLHFPSCPSLPSKARQTFKSLRGFDAKVATDDSQQYWVDAARDIGLGNVPPGGTRTVGAWGITFRRDPLQPSPADELDMESDQPELGKNSLVRADDKGLCTDQVMLLLRQVRPCRFKNSDRRAGPGSRGRDRVMGFPGLCCMHCTGKNTLGRYFPVSAKNLTDSTANSLQAHVSSCTRCPEPIKASLAYLSHRSILQKAELSGSWKKSFFQKIWTRLHVERKWTSVDDDKNGAGVASDADEDPHEEYDMGQEEEDSKDDGGDAASDTEEKAQVGDSMNALIQAAAIWLTEQDAATEVKGSNRSNKQRNLPAKRTGGADAAASSSPSRGGRKENSLPTKRRRVHF